MTQIKKITDKQGNDIYLRTHTKAVVDDNGYTAESRLQAMQDEINQKQLELGAIPSDLTPTEGSNNWVTSDGVYNQMFIGNANIKIDLTQYTERRAWIYNKQWSVATSYGIFIPVRPLQKYRIVGNAINTSAYAFLINDTTPSSKANVTTFAYPFENSIYIENGDTVIDTAPQDAAYMWVGTSDSAGAMDRAPQLVEEYNKESIIDSLSELANSTSEINAKLEELEDGLKRNQIQNIGGWQTSNSSVSPITIEEDSSVVITCGSSARIGFEISNIGDGEELYVSFHFEKSTAKTGSFAIGTTMTATWQNVVPVTGSATITPALKGDVEFSFIVPSGTQYLYLSAANFNGDTITISDLKVWTEQTLTEKFDSLDAVQRIPPTYTQYEYYGAKINIPSANHLAHEKYMNLNCSRMSSNYYQGAACYGNYLFVGGENGYELDIYNLATQSFVEHIEISGKTSNQSDHMNTLFFSNEFYSSGDDFPVLYSCSGTAVGSNDISYVHGYRLAQSEGSFTATLVHTITLNYGTWTEAVCDTEHGYLWVKHEESRTDENKMGWFKYTMPKATNGDVTLTMDTNVIDSFHLPSQDYRTASMQGFLYYEGNIYYTAGNGAQAGGLHLVSINTKTKCRETDINLAAIGLTQEPEFCIVYDKHLFVGYTNKLVKFYFD